MTLIKCRGSGDGGGSSSSRGGPIFGQLFRSDPSMLFSRDGSRSGGSDWKSGTLVFREGKKVKINKRKKWGGGPLMKKKNDLKLFLHHSVWSWRLCGRRALIELLITAAKSPPNQSTHTVLSTESLCCCTAVFAWRVSIYDYWTEYTGTWQEIAERDDSPLRTPPLDSTLWYSNYTEHLNPPPTQLGFFLSDIRAKRLSVVLHNTFIELSR